MKLSAPAVERGVRAQARRELRESRLLWKEYRQHRTRWWRRNRNFRAALGSVYILAILFLVAVRSGRALALLCVVALYASGTALFRCANYYARALRGYDRAVLIALPILDDDYLRHESRRFFRSWVGLLQSSFWPMAHMRLFTEISGMIWGPYWLQRCFKRSPGFPSERRCSPIGRSGFGPQRFFRFTA